MIPPFDEALHNLLAQYYHLKPEELVVELQKAIDKLRGTKDVAVSN